MLTQLLTLKTRLALEAFDTTDDTFLLNVIKLVSARFAAECNRIFDYWANLAFEFGAAVADGRCVAPRAGRGEAIRTVDGMIPDDQRASAPSSHRNHCHRFIGCASSRHGLSHS